MAGPTKLQLASKTPTLGGKKAKLGVASGLPMDNISDKFWEAASSKSPFSGGAPSGFKLQGNGTSTRRTVGY